MASFAGKHFCQGKKTLQLRRDSNLSIKFSGLISKKNCLFELIKIFIILIYSSFQNPKQNMDVISIMLLFHLGKAISSIASFLKLFLKANLISLSILSIRFRGSIQTGRRRNNNISKLFFFLPNLILKKFLMVKD